MHFATKNSLPKALILSILIHLIAIAFLLVNMPQFFTKLPTTKPVVTFEMLPVKKNSNIKKQDAKPPAKKKKLQDTATKPPAAVQKPDEKNIKTNKQQKLANPVNKVNSNTEKLAENKSTQNKTPKVKQKTAVKSKPVSQANNQVDQIDRILKDLNKSSDANVSKSKNIIDSVAMQYDENSALSISVASLAKQQIERNWHPPVGNLLLAKINMLLKTYFRIDGTVTDVKLIGMTCPKGAESLCNQVADSAIRAIWQASPLQHMPKEHYDNWRELNINVDPSGMAF